MEATQTPTVGDPPPPPPGAVLPEATSLGGLADADIIGMRDLLEAGVHFGHQTKRWNPKMRPYIYGARNGVHIVDLQHTARLFRQAYRFVVTTVTNGHAVLFVGTKKQAQDVVGAEARRAGMFYVTNRWLGGTLTNWRTIKQTIDRLNAIEKMRTDGTFERITKKERLGLDREAHKMERNLSGIKEMGDLPGAVFVIDPKKEQIAVREARRLEIPIVAVTDTNCDPDEVDYPIPGNDDAIRSIKLITSKIADACLLGKRFARDRAAAYAERDRADEAKAEPETIHVSSGGDGPTVELISRRSPRPEPEASSTPDTE